MLGLIIFIPQKCYHSKMGKSNLNVLKEMVMIAGIMQLAMLAPYNNLASSVAAALVPTLLAPHLHKSGSTHCHVL